MQSFEYENEWGQAHQLAFQRASYAHGGSLAVMAWCWSEDGYWEPYASLTVNLDDGAASRNRAYLDANNVEGLCDFVVGNGWAEVVGVGASGFCAYPLVEFSEEFVSDICSEGPPSVDVGDMRAARARISGISAATPDKRAGAGVSAEREDFGMAEETREQGEFSMDIPMKISSAWVGAPFEARYFDTGEPVVSKGGNQLYKAYATIPPGTKANGVDIGGYSIVVEYAWGDRGKAVMDSRKAGRERMVFDLARSADKEGRIYLNPPTDKEGNRVGEPMKVDAWEVTKAVKASREEYARNAEAQRAPKPGHAKKAPAPDEARAEAREMADAQAKSAPARTQAMSK